MTLKNDHKGRRTDHNEEHYDCSDIEQLVQKYLDGQLSSHEKNLFKEHIEYCVPCDKKVKFEIQLKEMVRLKSREDVPSEKLKDKLNRLFDELN